MQRWPVVPNAPHNAPSIANSRSRVFHDDLGVFTAELQGDAFEILAAYRRDLTPDGGGAGERNQLDVGMAHQRGADFFAVAMKQVDDAGRHAGLARGSRSISRQ